jgi:hypothetical protein
MIDWINTNMSRHILTIEDPVEFVHESRQSLIRHRGVGEHTKLFHNALRAALREDPDVILIGEIRDRETLTTALEASQTGHLVFGTLHTNSAVKTVERVLGMFPPNEQDSVRRAVSETLLGVISQGLLKTTDGKRCAFHDILINTDACKDYILKGDPSMACRPPTRPCASWWRTAGWKPRTPWPRASSPTNWNRRCGGAPDPQRIDQRRLSRAITSTARPRERPSMASRPFQISAWGVKPRRQALSSLELTGSAAAGSAWEVFAEAMAAGRSDRRSANR